MLEVFGDDHLVNFDDPISIDTFSLARHLQMLREGVEIQRPTYSMTTSNPTGEFVAINPSDTPVIFVEGIFALNPALKDLYDLTIFAHAPLATRVGRRLERDLAEGRSYNPEDNLRYLLEVAEPTYAPHAESHKQLAEIIFQNYSDKLE
jgi:uridine kinase